MMDAAAADAAGTWTDSARYQPSWLITRQQNIRIG